MNQEQIKSGVRWVLATFGGYFMAMAVQKKWITPEQGASLLSSEFVVGLLAAAASVVWSLIAKTQPNLVAAVDKLPGVEGVITTSTDEGKKLAASVPSSTVVPAGSAAAKTIAAS